MASLALMKGIGYTQFCLDLFCLLCNEKRISHRIFV